jgi:hypothetical protein
MARTGEPFAKDYNPPPGLVAGTCAGATGATLGMAVGARIVERLGSGGWLGRGGKVAPERGVPC